MTASIAAEQVSTEAAMLPIHEIATFLREHIGQRMTGYLSGVNDPKMVSHWIACHNSPRDQAQLRLREAYQAARLIVSSCGDEPAKAWFFGSNARLDDQAPPTCCGMRKAGRTRHRPGGASVRPNGRLMQAIAARESRRARLRQYC